ncbi:MAG: hypothetical protein FWE41_02490 [Coriobacteriia bacterium]|nr:hypothetical protein [Coriobacteriia bacterium]MCL2750760.1 hypothetical protein [Coriobacteriia bacterium]
MAGHKFIVGGEPAVARDTIYTILGNQGFTVNQTGEWSARAERGSKAASLVLGALAGKKGRHVIIDLELVTTPEGNLDATFTQKTSGASGGLLGASQAIKIYQEIYDSVGEALQSDGILISNTKV